MRPKDRADVKGGTLARVSVTPSHLAAATPLPHARVLEAFFSQRSPRTAEAYKEALMAFGSWLESVGLLAPDDYDIDAPDTTLAAITRVLFSWTSPEAHANGIAYVQWMGEKGFAPSTINHRLSAVRAFVRLGARLGLVTWMLDVRGVRAGLVRDVRGPTIEQVRQLLDAARTHPRLYAMLLLLFERGLRSIELRELRMKHLKLSAGTTPSILVRGKGKAGLTPLTISAEAAAALEAWVAMRGDAVPDPESFVFFRQGHPDVPLSKAAIWKIISDWGNECGVKLWPHALRHSAITEALDATNGDIRRVQQFSRHAKVETVMRYDDSRRDVGGEVTEMLSSRSKGAVK